MKYWELCKSIVDEIYADGMEEQNKGLLGCIDAHCHNATMVTEDYDDKELDKFLQNYSDGTIKIKKGARQIHISVYFLTTGPTMTIAKQLVTSVRRQKSLKLGVEKNAGTLHFESEEKVDAFATHLKLKFNNYKIILAGFNESSRTTI